MNPLGESTETPPAVPAKQTVLEPQPVGKNEQQAVLELCGLLPIAQVRSPYVAVRALGGCVDLLKLYAMQPNELLEAGEERAQLSPYGFCCALGAKKGYRQTRSGAPDPHRAGLLVIRDCAQGAVAIASTP